MESIVKSREKSLLQKTNGQFLNAPFLWRYARWWMASALGFGDLVSLFAAGALATSIWRIVKVDLRTEIYVDLAPMGLIFLGVFALRGLYPAIGVSPVQELRRLMTSITFVFLALATLTFWVRSAEIYSRAIFGLTWIFALGMVPVGRILVRTLGVRLQVWGEPIAIIGYGPQGQEISKFLSINPRYGLRPAIALSNGHPGEFNPNSFPVLPIEQWIEGHILPKVSGIRTAILVIPEIPEKLLGIIIEGQRLGFPRLVLVSNIHHASSIGVTPYDLGGILGLEVRRNLLNRWEMALNRVLDITLIVLSSPVSIPIFGLLALLIKLDSRGPIFYQHPRIGQNGSDIKVLKFRTMVPDADQILEHYLQTHPELRAEWKTTQKLKDDPRITRVGRFLRKFSLDELPQVWNVLKGEMSLVGPRPIVTEEIKHYGDRFDIYTQVRPGITGLWQVSGRNDTSYEERVRLDEYYVRNWSIWLDIYILARTVWVVLNGNGAY
jgi:Undecaprenyl-phosphate galactose phosphotransferase WbaP